jgi:ABC-type bacteriocin/lantibiotic exporter with double-glycine peptidase domain
MKLSGGQRQRLMIAAAIIQQLRLVVIDEATSSLDAETELKVQTSIEKMLGMDTTAFVIAHRLCTLRFCDKIIIMRPLDRLQGDEQQIEYIATSFADALENSPTFAKFADIQRQLIAF